jgi:hypothetical protein
MKKDHTSCRCCGTEIERLKRLIAKKNVELRKERERSSELYLRWNSADWDRETLD